MAYRIRGARRLTTNDERSRDDTRHTCKYDHSRIPTGDYDDEHDDGNDGNDEAGESTGTTQDEREMKGSGNECPRDVGVSWTISQFFPLVFLPVIEKTATRHQPNPG